MELVEFYSSRVENTQTIDFLKSKRKINFTLLTGDNVSFDLMNAVYSLLYDNNTLERVTNSTRGNCYF